MDYGHSTCTMAMYYGHSTYTMATRHVLLYVWLSSLVMRRFGEAARRPNGGLSHFGKRDGGETYVFTVVIPEDGPPSKQGGFGGPLSLPNGGPSHFGKRDGGETIFLYSGHPWKCRHPPGKKNHVFAPPICFSWV